MFQANVVRPSLFQARQTNGVGRLVFLVCVLGGAAASSLMKTPVFIAAGAVIGVYFLLAIKVVDQWEKVAVLRFGRFRELRGPGIFLIIPVVDTLSRYVDQRVRVTTVSAESTLTRDTVPVNVDAIVFWLVWNAEKAIFEVEDFIEAITLGSQTALRESIGRAPTGADDYGAGDAGAGAAEDSRREDDAMGHHGAVGGDSRRADSAGA